jgi:phosphate transport system protein
MSKHLQRDLDRLKKQLLEVGSLVEEGTNKAILALTELRKDLAEEVIALDTEIDSREVEIEEECLKILALHQPVARDLRFVIGVLKVNNDLERMGDQAVNIAERAILLTEFPPLGVPLDFNRMAEVVRSMVRSALDAHVNEDTDLAKSIRMMDDEVDDLHREMFNVLESRMCDESGIVERAVAYLSASRDLERIADLATNIAEDVIFMVEGQVVRHRVPEPPSG